MTTQNQLPSLLKFSESDEEIQQWRDCLMWVPDGDDFNECDWELVNEVKLKEGVYARLEINSEYRIRRETKIEVDPKTGARYITEEVLSCYEEGGPVTYVHIAGDKDWTVMYDEFAKKWCAYHDVQAVV